MAWVIDGATLVVDAGADFPAELAMLTVRLRGAGAEDATALAAGRSSKTARRRRGSAAARRPAEDILLLCADRGVERDPPVTERAAHELIKALAALPKRRAGRGGATTGKCGSWGLFAGAGQRLEAELARAA